MNEKYIIIFFDGKCKLCNFWVNFVIKNDKSDIFKFCTLQTKGVKKILDIKEITLDTIYVLDKKKIYTKYYASTFVMSKLNKFLLIPFYLNYIFPKFVLNLFYDIVGKNRYRLFGYYKECLVPSDSLEKKFIKKL